LAEQIYFRAWSEPPLGVLLPWASQPGSGPYSAGKLDLPCNQGTGGISCCLFLCAAVVTTVIQILRAMTLGLPALQMRGLNSRSLLLPRISPVPSDWLFIFYPIAFHLLVRYLDAGTLDDFDRLPPGGDCYPRPQLRLHPSGCSRHCPVHHRASGALRAVLACRRPMRQDITVSASITVLSCPASSRNLRSKIHRPRVGCMHCMSSGM
jgi:hypothetical protein